MHFAFACPACRFENQIEYHDSGAHRLTCGGCGRAYAVYLRKHKFETLFDFGTRALLDGYAREAVMNFASSLERFFEFYVRAATLARVAGGERSLEAWQQELDAIWKSLARQSERQLGAFALAYLLHQGRAPDFLSPQKLDTEFRNRVIHQGYIPARAEVNAYAERVFALIDRVLADLGDAALQAQLEEEARMQADAATLPDGVTPVGFLLPGMFKVLRFTHGQLENPLLFARRSLTRSGPVGGSRLMKLPLTGPDQPPANDAHTFQAAMRERQPYIDQLFVKKAPEPIENGGQGR